MEGGVAILLLLIIVVVAGGFAIAMYLTGGALWLSKDKDGERDERSNRPEHKRVTSKTIENTEVVGTRQDDQ
jgi:hypothetical protein